GPGGTQDVRCRPARTEPVRPDKERERIPGRARSRMLPESQNGHGRLDQSFYEVNPDAWDKRARNVIVRLFRTRQGWPVPERSIRLRDLESLTKRELEEAHRCGPKVLATICAAMAAAGIVVPDGDPPPPKSRRRPRSVRLATELRLVTDAATGLPQWEIREAGGYETRRLPPGKGVKLAP